MFKIIDNTNLSYLWGKITAKFSSATNWKNGTANGSIRTNGSMAEDDSYTIGVNATTEGRMTRATGSSSHAEGNETLASGHFAHAEGTSYHDVVVVNNSIYETIIPTLADGEASHAEGIGTTASGAYSHAEGYRTTASGGSSHAEGSWTVASGSNAHASGRYTTAQRKSQTVIGEFNALDTGGSSASTRGDYAFIIGNGTSSSARSNAYAVEWEGDSTQAGRATTKDMTSAEIAAYVQSLGLHGRAICPYGVGDIYETANSVDPSTIWDNTSWTCDVIEKDYVVEEGISGIWTYRKWASGVVDMWGVSTGSESPYGGVTFGYWYPHSRSITFPFSIKNVSGSYDVFCGSGWAIPGSSFPYSHNDSSSGITSSTIYSLASTSGTISVTYKIVVHGLWKTRETPQTIYKWRRLS